MKAAYYELASNTKHVSEQMGALANTFYLIKHDLESKAMNNVDMREVTRSMDYEPSTILNDKLTAEIYPYTQTLSQINNSKAMDTLLSNNTQFSTFKAHQTQLQRQIETLKNELNLTSKVKSTLELQLQEYRKQNVSVGLLIYFKNRRTHLPRTSS